MTRRQLFKNFGLGLAGLLALPLFGKPGKGSEPKLATAPWSTSGTWTSGSVMNVHIKRIEHFKPVESAYERVWRESGGDEWDMEMARDAANPDSPISRMAAKALKSMNRGECMPFAS